MRIGQGFDLHRFVEGRKLILGGVEVPHSRGLSGHSDADILSHAIVDAILGAVGEGDIGAHFPDNDPRWKDASSRIFLEKAVNLAAEKGYRIGNIDSTILAEGPRIKPYRDKIRENLAEILQIPVESVSVKATTMEGTGAIGRGEAMAAQAIVLLEESTG